jgi:hypothetical protein
LIGLQCVNLFQDGTQRTKKANPVKSWLFLVLARAFAEAVFTC